MDNIPFRYVLIVITDDALCIVDKGNIENHTNIPLKNILWYQLFREDNFEFNVNNRRELDRYCTSLVKIFFEVNINGKKKILRFYFSDDKDKPFNMYSLKRSDFFKLLDERVPKRKIENTLE